MAKKRDGLVPKGVMRREATQELVCDVRFKQGRVKGKFHATQIGSLEEGAFFYDIVKLYERRISMGAGSSGKARLLELNYPDLSPTLQLCELPVGFDIKGNHKEQVQRLILEQARRAARELRQSKNEVRAMRKSALMKLYGMLQKCSRHMVDSRQSALDDPISTHQNVVPLPVVVEDQMKFSEMHASSHGVQTSPFSLTYPHNDDRLQKACELLEYCRTQYLSRVAERKDLERKLAGSKEALGYISLPATSKREDFCNSVAFIKRNIKRDGELFGQLEKLEQAYQSEQSKCWELRKGLQEHNLKSIDERLNENEAGEALHVIKSIKELLVESPTDVLQSPWLPLFFSPHSNGGEWNLELENLLKILSNSAFSPT